VSAHSGNHRVTRAAIEIEHDIEGSGPPSNIIAINSFVMTRDDFLSVLGTMINSGEADYRIS